jgi:putative colanic acid biosynthesis acetyltransferase WcaF
MSFHDINDADAYKRSVFSTSNKIKRLLWQITWFLFCNWTPAPLHFWRVFILRLFGATIGNSNFIYPNCKIWAPWNLFTEDVVTIGPGVEIYNPEKVTLGHHSILSQDAYLCGATHDYNSIYFSYLKKEINLEPYVWICAKAIVLPGVTCYEGSVLGASSITSKDMECWSVYAGNPSKVIKKRHNFLK